MQYRFSAPYLQNETRRCRQCFAVKPMVEYLNQSRNGFCVVCARCRSSQRRRYYLKREKLRKKMEKLENQSSKSNQPSVTTIVPSSQWKVMDSSVTVTDVSSEIPVATLLYYATCVKYEDSPPSSPRSSSF